MWWRKYLFLKRATQILFGISFLCTLLLLGRNPHSIPARAVSALVLVSFGSALWWNFLDCPRCGENFRSWSNRWALGDECQNCGLTYRELSSIAKPEAKL
jgi:hypothetical protein